VPASGSLAPSVVFAENRAARLPLVLPFGRCLVTTFIRPRRLHTRYGPVSCFAPLRTRPLDHARERPYRGPGRLPEPDLPWLVASVIARLFTSCHRNHSFCHGARAAGHTDLPRH
jgi:hypothetical protein